MLQKYDKCYQLVQSLVAGVSEKEAHDALNSSVSKSPQAHDDVSHGLLVWLLSEPAASSKVRADGRVGLSAARQTVPNFAEWHTVSPRIASLGTAPRRHTTPFSVRSGMMQPQ